MDTSNQLKQVTNAASDPSQGVKIMTEAAVPVSPAATMTWRAQTPHVRKALAFVKRKGHVTAEELVEWDRTHGRRLFDWEDPKAADEWRKQQARTFLNRFRAKFEGMRVRAFIHLREDEAQKIEHDGYYTVEQIAENSGMREQVIADITRRMANLASELKMWGLSPSEQSALFDRLADAMNGKVSEAA